MAIASSPVPRSELLRTVRLFPPVAPRLTLLTLHPSAQMLVRRQFCAVPPVPEAQKPESVCCVQMPSATQLVPVLSIPPPAPSTEARLSAFESSAKFRTRHELRLKIAPRGTALGRATLRWTRLYHMPAPCTV